MCVGTQTNNLRNTTQQKQTLYAIISADWVDWIMHYNDYNEHDHTMDIDRDGLTNFERLYT